MFHVLDAMFQFPRVRQHLVSHTSALRTNVMCLPYMLVSIFLYKTQITAMPSTTCLYLMWGNFQQDKRWE